MKRLKQEVRGVPLWLVREYLQEMGGQVTPDGSIQGPGWLVRLSQVDDYQVGSLSVGQVSLELEADPGVFDDISQGLRRKLLRAGG